jgi:hypothetical protein
MAIAFTIPYRLKDSKRVKCDNVKPKEPGTFCAAIKASLDYSKKNYKFPIKITLEREGIFLIDNDHLEKCIAPIKQQFVSWFMKIPGNDDPNLIEWEIKQHKGRKFCVNVEIVPIVPEYEAYKNAKAKRLNASKS